MHTRPPAVSNTNGQVIANAYEIRKGPIAAKHSHTRRTPVSFIPHCSMLAHVIGVDWLSRACALRCDFPILVVHDCTPTFHCVARDFARLPWYHTVRQRSTQQHGQLLPDSALTTKLPHLSPRGALSGVARFPLSCLPSSITVYFASHRGPC